MEVIRIFSFRYALLMKYFTKFVRGKLIWPLPVMLPPFSPFSSQLMINFAMRPKQMCNKMCSPCCTQQQTLQHKLKRKMFIYAAACWRVKRGGQLAPQFPVQHLHFDAVLRMMWRAPANSAYQPHEIKRPKMKSEELQVGKLQEGADRGRWRAEIGEPEPAASCNILF